MRKITLYFLLLTASINLPAKDLYVSTGGKENNPGTLAKPFASVERAQHEALKYHSEAVNIYLLSGTYYLKRPLLFTRGRVTISAFQHQQVTLKGSVRLKLQWEPYNNGVFKAHIPVGVLCDQLFINDKLQLMARYPNYNKNIKPYGGTAEDAISDERVKMWKDPSGGFIHAMHSGQWGDFVYEITGKDAGGKLNMEGGWQTNRPSTMHKQLRYVENIFEELDTAGEWFFDKKNRILYYKPISGFALNKAVVEFPQLETLVKIKGIAHAPITEVTFKGITFAHTLRTFMKTREPLLRSDWTFYRGGAIMFENTKACKLSNCTLRNLGGNAVVFSGFNQASAVDSSHLYNIGASAIAFVGDPSAVRSPSFHYSDFVPLAQIDTLAGPKNDAYPINCQAADNLIHDIGLFEKQVAGIEISMSRRIQVKHNTIYNVPRAGINIGDGTWGGHDIAFNDVFNTVLETSDHGALNAWGRDRYWHPKRATMDTLVANHPKLILLDAVETTRIYNNRFRCDNGWDIDLDDGATNYSIFNNVCLNGGLKLREGFYRDVENNIILNNALHSNVFFNNSHDQFKHNIISSAYVPARKNDWGKDFNLNLFPDNASLKSAQDNQSDVGSNFGDPLFIDAAQGNYSVKQASPALKIGFKNFDMTFGTRLPRLKQLAKKVSIPQLITNQPLTDQVYDFLGAKVKDLTTLTEQSATGMDSKTGVLLLEVAGTSVLANQLYANDVMLEYAGVQIKNVKELYYAKAMNQYKKVVPVVVFRDQVKVSMTLKIK